ncbi:MAG: transcriptional coactivator p15/PC4 family protein [Candidatus Bipolaricaulota bacterium]|nr:transcriptional coactivator p15/PC4 family protein [Candidatus Bipolaricaulota bacterium]
MPEEKQVGDEQLIKTIDKGMGSRIHVRLSHFHDRDYLDIRNFYEAEEGEWKPTRKGIAVPVELYGELISALQEAEPLIKKLQSPTPAKKDEG